MDTFCAAAPIALAAGIRGDAVHTVKIGRVHVRDMFGEKAKLRVQLLGASLYAVHKQLAPSGHRQGGLPLWVWMALVKARARRHTANLVIKYSVGAKGLHPVCLFFHQLLPFGTARA